MGVGVALGRPKGPIIVEMIGRVVPARCRSLLLASRRGTSVPGPGTPKAGGAWSRGVYSAVGSLGERPGGRCGGGRHTVTATMPGAARPLYTRVYV